MTTLLGKLIQAGDLTDNNGDPVTGLLIECPREVLKTTELPLYGEVLVTPAVQPGEPDRRSYSAAELEAKAKAWLTDLYGSAPRDLRHEQREAYHRDLGLFTSFIHDHFP